MGQSYYEFGGEHYYLTQSSGQIKHGLTSLFNHSFISIPNGSEDDKNPLKKNHYEESIFKFEDQRFEMDMFIDSLTSCLEDLSKLRNPNPSQLLEEDQGNEPAVSISKRRNSPLLNNSINIQKDLSHQTISQIKKVYKEYSQQILESLNSNPIEISDIIMERLKKRLIEAQSQKIELEKNIRSSFDRFYSKSFDYRSFKFKNNEKKNTNSKAFIKEIAKKSQEKLYSSNSNLLKGGIDNSEFYNSFTSKHFVNPECKHTNKEQVLNINDLNATTLNSYNEKASKLFNPHLFKRFLPDLRLNFCSTVEMKITIYLIVMYIENCCNAADKVNIQNYLEFIFEAIFHYDISEFTNENSSAFLFMDPQEDKQIQEILESKINSEDIEKANACAEKRLASALSCIKENYEVQKWGIRGNNRTSSISKSLSPKISNTSAKGLTPVKTRASQGNLSSEVAMDLEESEISFTPSLRSEDNGQTFKKTLVHELKKETKDIFENNKNLIPGQESKDVIFYCNESFYVIVRYIYCIYERLCKLNENNQFLSRTLINSKSYNNPNFCSETPNVLSDMLNQDQRTAKGSKLFVFVFILKAYIHKRIEHPNQFEECCRDILGNDSYYLLNLDKLLLSVSSNINYN